MRIKVNQKDFLQILSISQGITEVIDVKPILAQVLINARKDGLEVTASGLDMAVNIWREVKEGVLEVEKEGKLVIPARRLFDLVKELPDGSVNVKSKDNHWAEISYPAAGAKRTNMVQLIGLNPDEYPELPKLETEEEEIRVEAGVLVRMIESTVIAASKDERRNYLQGVFFCIPQNEKAKGEAKKTKEVGIRMVATNGHRLALMNAVAEASKGTNENLRKGVILPRKGIQEVKRIAGYLGDNEMVRINIGASMGRVRIGNDSIFLRFIEGDFPDYNAVIPEKNRNVVRMNRSGLIKSLKRVSALSGRDIQGLKIKVDKGSLVLHSYHPDTGEIREESDVEYKGKTLEMNFNARYLSEGLESFSDDELSLDLGDEISPLMIYGVEGRDHLVLIMPLRNE